MATTMARTLEDRRSGVADDEADGDDDGAAERDLDERAGRAGGHRVTLPRLLVHRHVWRAGGHVTPERVRSALAPVHPGLSPATIYATLDLLEGLELVRRVSTPRGGRVYDARTDAHHHLVCRRCGRVEDIDAPVSTAAVEARARAAGFAPERAEVQLSGLCRACDGAQERPWRT
jgi:Fe2+ or Zn2+ uptake regulation protein